MIKMNQKLQKKVQYLISNAVNDRITWDMLFEEFSEIEENFSVLEDAILELKKKNIEIVDEIPDSYSCKKNVIPEKIAFKQETVSEISSEENEEEADEEPDNSFSKKLELLNQILELLRNSSQEKNTSSNVKMEIISNKEFGRANIRFSSKPSEEVRTLLKNEGWIYNHTLEIWYPRGFFASQNSFKFAAYIKRTFFPEN